MMDMNKLMECERKQMGRFQLLPNFYKKIGVGLLIASLLAMIVLWLIPGESEMAGFVLEKSFLVGLLLVSISKDKVEDEMTLKLRAQSYSFAFVAGIVYTIVQPLINYWVAILLKPEKAIFEELDAFIILWFMLVVQLAYFYLLKRTS